MVECRYDSNDLEKIREVVSLDEIQIYLRPNMDNLGAAGVASKIANVKDGAVSEIGDGEIDGDKFVLSRFWLDIIGIMPGYFTEDKNDFIKYEDEDEDWYGYGECVHIPIGCVTGYAIDKKDFALAMENDRVMRNVAITFDCISQILSDFWYVIARGELSCLFEDYDEYLMEDEKKIIYYLDDIYYKKGFEDVKLDRAVINLLESAVEDYLSKELEEIVYEPFRSDLFEPVGFVDGEREVYIERAKMLKEEGFKSVKERGFDLVDEMEYYVKVVNGYNDVNGEEIIVDIEG